MGDYGFYTNEEKEEVVKRKSISEESELESKSLRVGVSIGLIEDATTALIKDRKIKLATEIVNQIINNDSIDEDTKSIMKKQLIKIAILEKRYDDAKSMVNEILSNENVSDEYKNKIKRRLITIAISEGNIDEAERIAYQLLGNEEVTRTEKIKVQSQLITVAMKREDYTLAKYRAEEILNYEDTSIRTKFIVLKQMIKIARKEGRHDDARTMENKLKNKEDLADVIEYALSTQSKVEDVVKTQEREDIPNVEKAQEIEDKRDEEPRIEEINEINNAPEVHTNLIEMSDKRKAIYRGEISMEDISDLAEQNKDTLEGCLFIAEACSHLDLKHLGSNCLRGYRKNNSGLKQSDMKTISKALELLKRDILNAQMLKEEWNKIYEYLEQARDGEEISV